MAQQATLAQLLNDETFLRWLNGEATWQEQQQWDQWLSDDESHRILAKKARKIINMPFKKSESEPNSPEEWRRFKEALARLKQKDEQ